MFGFQHEYHYIPESDKAGYFKLFRTLICWSGSRNDNQGKKDDIFLEDTS